MSHTRLHTHTYTHSQRTLKTCFSTKRVSSCHVYWPQLELVNCRLVHQSHSMQIINKNFEPMSEKPMNRFCFECNMGTMSAFLLSLRVRCPVWNCLARLGVHNSKVLWLKYFVLHKSTGAAEHKPAVYRLFFALARACRGTSDSWTAKQHWGQRRHGNREIRQCFCGGFTASQSFLLLEGKPSDEERVSASLSAAYWRSTWIQFLFCTQSLGRVTVATVSDCVQYCSARALKSPKCALQARKRLARGTLGWKLEVLFI